MFLEPATLATALSRSVMLEIEKCRTGGDWTDEAAPYESRTDERQEETSKLENFPSRTRNRTASGGIGDRLGKHEGDVVF